MVILNTIGSITNRCLGEPDTCEIESSRHGSILFETQNIIISFTYVHSWIQ